MSPVQAFLGQDLSDPKPPYRHAPTCPVSQRPAPPEDWPPVGTVPSSYDTSATGLFLSPETVRLAHLATLRELLGHLRNLGPEQEEWADAVKWAVSQLKQGGG